MGGDALPGSGRDLSLKELSAVYHLLAGEWLLLEIVQGEFTAPGARFRLHAHHPDKERLHEFLLENDDWDWQRRYLFVHADPDKPCPTGTAGGGD
ncbi:MAG: hypothetical protein HYX74_05200 [Acidobacteria bacterium]|nr:hypothetical protein [Acidobacteriota bacterium]